MTVEIYLGEEFKRQFKRLAKKYHSLTNDFKVLCKPWKLTLCKG